MAKSRKKLVGLSNDMPTSLAADEKAVAQNLANVYFRLGFVTSNYPFGDEKFSFHDPGTDTDLSFCKRSDADGDSDVKPDDGIAVAIGKRHIPERHLTAALESGKLSPKKESVRTVFNELNELLQRTLRLIRWRTNYPSKDRNLFRLTSGFSWSLDKADWKPVDRDLSLAVEWSVVPLLNAQIEEFVATNVISSRDEPLAHELLREAVINRNDNPRSALVLAVAAAEVGFKQFAAKKFPDSEWLLNLPTPPLEKMLESFPWAKLKLQINNVAITFPEPLKDELRKAIRLRNELVHVGNAKLKYQTISELLASVNDMLYFLDALEQQDWALEFVRRETLEQFTNPR